VADDIFGKISLHHLDFNEVRLVEEVDFALDILFALLVRRPQIKVVRVQVHD